MEALGINAMDACWKEMKRRKDEKRLRVQRLTVSSSICARLAMSRVGYMCREAA
jgi:hypothetical protein